MSWAIKVIRWSFYLLFFLVPLIFLPNTSELFEFNKMIVVYLLTSVIAGAWLSEMILQKRLILSRSALDWPILVFLASQSFSLFFSIDTRTSLLGYYSRFNGGLISLVCYSILYWSFVTFMDQKSSLRTLHLALSTAGFVSLYGIAQHLGIDDHLWVQDVKTRVFSTLGQPNWLAAYLVVLIFIPLSKAWSSKNWSTGQLVNWSTFLLLFITLLFTKSRSGFMAFGLSWAVYWILVINKSGIGSLKKSLAMVIWGSVIVSTLVVGNPLRDILFNTKHITLSTAPAGPALESGGTESGIIRRIVWQGAIGIWRASPKNFWLGSGPETFAMAYYQHRPIEHNATSEWELLYNKAHNEFLNYLATTGILGLGSYLFLLGSMFFLIIKMVQGSKFKSPDAVKSSFEPWILNLALLAGWLTLPVTNFWGFSVVVTNLFLFLLPAFAISLNTPPRPQNNIASKLPRPVQIIAIFFCIFATLSLCYSVTRYWLADVKYASGKRSLDLFTSTQDPTYILSAYTDYLAAFGLNSADPPLTTDLATVMAYMSLLTSDSDASASARLSATSLALSESAIDKSPYHPNYYKALSRTAIILSALDPKYLSTARSALEYAFIISPTDPRIPYNLAVVAKYQLNTAETADYLEQALRLKPDFIDAIALKSELASSSAAFH